MKKSDSRPFLASMAPRPGLEPYARQAEIAGSSLFYFDSSTQSTLNPCLLVHGLGDEADTWCDVFLALTRQRRVIAVDLPGFGRSALPQQPVSIPVYVNTLLELLNTLNLPPVTLVGHSLGAILVQQLALENPPRATNLVMISGGLAAGKAALSLELLLFLIPGIGEWAYNHLRRDPQVAYQTLAPYYAHLEQLPQDTRDFLLLRVNQRVWSDQQRRAFLGVLRSLVRWLPAQQKGLVQRLAASRIPTKIIWGTEDQITPVQTAHLLASLYPPDRAAQLTLIPGAGHNVHQEFPEKIVELIP